jgi:hypothetical protein
MARIEIRGQLMIWNRFESRYETQLHCEWKKSFKNAKFFSSSMARSGTLDQVLVWNDGYTCNLPDPA